MPVKAVHKSVSKTSKKSLQESIKELKEFITKYKYFFIIGHERPDGDCVGSQVACAGLLEKLNKKAFLISTGPFTDNVAQLYQSMFYNSYKSIESAPPLDSPDVAVLCVDISSQDRTGLESEEFKKLPTAVIDHHRSGSRDAQVQYIDPSAPANTLLVYRLFKEYKITPSKQDAHFILLGLLTDTQFFRFVRAKDTESFETAAKMVQLGVSPKEIYNQIGYGYTFLSRKVIAKILSRAIRVNNNRVIITYLSHKDYLYKDDIPQSHEVYQMLQGVQKIEVVVYINEDIGNYKKTVCKVGVRSHSRVDVSEIAQQFGGGGHKKASGFLVKKPLLETYKMLKKYFDELPM